MSGLNDVVAAGVETAFDAARDFVVLGTYYSKSTTPVYDPSTDTMTGQHVTVPNVRILRTAASREEREASQVSVGDVKFIIPARDLGVVKPSEVDEIRYADEMYNVLAIKAVPGDSLHIIMARKK